jgi:hypothetical protein
MKKFAIAVVIVVGASSVFAQTYIAPARPRKGAPLPPPPPVTAPQAGGVIPRAVRSGNPLQMVNPFAPARYGTAEQSVLLKPDGSGKWDGIKLVSIEF